MRCPYCHNPAFEDTAACSKCGLSLAKADQVFGAPPAVDVGVTDLAGVVTQRARRRILRAISSFEHAFPQIKFSALFQNLGAETPLAVYSFWIFNRSGICRDIDGAANRNILLTVDIANRRANLIVGYGLEPFVGPPHLREALEFAAPRFADSAWSSGTEETLRQLRQILIRVSSSIDRTYGVSLQQIYAEDDRRPTQITRKS